MMMSFNEFIRKLDLKIKATSNMKIQQILSSLSLSDAQIYLRNRPFSSEVVIISLCPTKASHWLVYKNENFSGSYGCSPPIKLYNLSYNQMDIVCFPKTKYKIWQKKIFFLCSMLFLNKLLDKSFRVGSEKPFQICTIDWY